MRQATIQFKGKVTEYQDVRTLEMRRGVKLPEFKHSHCDMQAFRVHPKYGTYANSDLFPGVLKRIKRDLFGACPFVDVEHPPAGVTVDASGFLAVVTITV